MLTPKDQIPHQLMITQGNDNEPTEIIQKDCSEPHKTLGVMKAPNRSQNGEIQRLLTKCNDHAKAILSNSVTSSDSIIAYRVYHLTSIGYSLSTTYIAEADLKKVQGRAISAFLATSGFNRNMERRLVFSPRNHGGIGMVPLILLQGQQGIKMLRRHILHQTELGRQILIDLAWIQQEAGTSQPILENTHIDLDYIEDGWILGIRRFLQLVSAAIKLINNPRPQTCRHGDSYIMDTFRENSISTSELRTLNRCRLYFQVDRISDITNIVGTQLYDHVLTLDRDKSPQSYPTYPQTRLKWPRQPRPGLIARKLWKKYINAILLQTDGRLRTPLGKWTLPVDHRDRLYPTLYHAASQTIHQSDGNQYLQFPVQYQDRRSIQATIDAPVSSTRHPGYPVDLISINNQTLFAQCTPRNTLTTTMPPGTTQHHRFGKLPAWKADLLRHTTIYEEHRHLLASSPTIVVSDGGMEGGKGYFGYIIAVGKIIIAHGRGVARGDPRTMDSFRAEACGFLAGICLLHLLMHPTPTTTPTSIHTDSASLLARLTRATSNYVPTGFWLKPSSDIIMQLVDELKTTPNIQRHYVRGHQDLIKKKKDLTLPELYNIKADDEATIMRFQMTCPASQVIPFPASIINVYIQQQLISSSLDTLLHEELT